MSAVALDSTLPIFTGLDGLPLSSGYVYIGVANQDPRTFPMAAFWDSALSIAATQPLRTTAGYVVRAGAPSPAFINGQFSLLVLDSSGSQVFYAPVCPGHALVDISTFMSTVLTAGTAGAARAALGVDEWLLYGAAPTYVSATSFSVVGDQTALFHVGRRVKTTNTGGTRYGTITVSAFGAGITTVTITNDSGTLDVGLSAVSYGQLAAVAPSLPDSAAVRASLGVSTGYSSTASASGGITLPSWLGGFGIRWGNVTTGAVSDVTATFSTPFNSAFYAAIATVVNGGGSGSTLASLGATSINAVNIGAYVSSTGARATATVYYFAVGK